MQADIQPHGLFIREIVWCRVYRELKLNFIQYCAKKRSVCLMKLINHNHSTAR